ncbi:MAG: hypothetical protein LBT66_04055, partial [Methanobrevibacter sp.]|nr:hypothetical protein [Candidatus Methanovirga meridionalis]
SFSASSITKEKSSYNIKTPRLIGDTDYNVSVKPASGNSDNKYNILNPNIYNTTTKIRTKLELISGTGNVNHTIGYVKDVPFKHVVTYKLTNADNDKPLVSQPVDILGKNHERYVPARRVWDPKARQYIMEPAHVEVTPYYLNSTNDGIITVTYSDYGDFSLKTEYKGDNDSLPTDSGGNYVIIKKIVGEGKQVIIHSAGYGGWGTPSHWTTDNNGFNFSRDPNWLLAFTGETTLKFYDIDGNKISSKTYTITSGEGNTHINIPAEASTMDITCGIKDGGDHTTRKGIEAGKAAINYDGTAGGSLSTRNCHVITDTWDSDYIILFYGFDYDYSGYW